MTTKVKIVIVGAGMAGISAGCVLRENKQTDFLIIEKSRSVGGRMATRRIDEGKVDHGAQFFTARTARFQTAIEQWLARGLVKPWFGEHHARYMSPNGMNALAKALANELPVRLNTEISEIKEQDNGFLLTTTLGEKIYAAAVLVTAPAPQAKALLIRGQLPLAQPVIDQLDAIRFHPCHVGLFQLTEAPPLPESGHLDNDLPEGVMRIVDHYQKGISAAHTVSVYMTGAWSLGHDDNTDRDILAEVSTIVAPYIDPRHVLSVQLKKWRYAEAIEFLRQPYMTVTAAQPLLIAGDAFLAASDKATHTRLESAFISGVLAGEALLNV